MRAPTDRLLRLLSASLLAAAAVVAQDPVRASCPTEGAVSDCPASASPPPSPGGDEGATATGSPPSAASTAPSGPTSAGGTATGGPDPNRLETGLTWDYCGFRPARLGRLPSEPPPGPDTPVEFTADALDYDQNGEVLVLSGAIKGHRGNQWFEAEHLRYHRRAEQFDARGDVLFGQPRLRFLGSSGTYNLSNNSGQVSDVYYRLIGTNGRGSAIEAEILNDDHSRYRNTRYTTCPPGPPAWELHAEKLEIDRETGTGTGWHTKLRVGDVPVFYWPYLSFPIDGRRKSGFLIPSAGHSSARGLELKVPYYFNLAPNMDLTFSSDLMSKRGLMLGGEVRFLTENHRGTLYGEIVPRDPEYQDKVRGAAHFADQGSLAPGWTTDIDVNYVSDDSYLKDFRNNLQITSQRNLERRGDLVYTSDNLLFRGRLQEFQTVEAGLPNSSRPYSRLPQLIGLYDHPGLWSGLDGTLGGEYDYFSHKTLVHGQRFSLRPTVSWPLYASYGYLLPGLILNHSSYSLTDQTPGLTDTPSYTIPSAKLDGTLVLERPWEGFGLRLIQTLEPRAYYLYTPYRNQNAAPLFDSTELDLSYANLFRDNRFTGRDRIGDANQLSLGLTSRGLSQGTGRELYRGSIGQIYYFRDREVQILGPTEKSRTSPLIGEVAGLITDRWRGRAGLAWDPQNDNKKMLQQALELRYQGADNVIFNAAYRYNWDAQAAAPEEDTSYRDIDISFRWPVNAQVELVGRWYYSLLYNEVVDTLAGIEFGRCCWRVRAVARQVRDQSGGGPSNSFLLQFELAGLGQFGQRVDRLLERSIYGYRGETLYGDLDH